MIFICGNFLRGEKLLPMYSDIITLYDLQKKIETIFTLRTINFFTFSLIFLILLWPRICWWNLEIFCMVMPRFFSLKIYQWTHSDKTLLENLKITRKLIQLPFWTLVRKLMKKFLIEYLAKTWRKFPKYLLLTRRKFLLALWKFWDLLLKQKVNLTKNS